MVNYETIDMKLNVEYNKFLSPPPPPPAPFSSLCKKASDQKIVKRG